MNFVQRSGVGVKIGTEWRYFDPCAPYMPFGFLPWQREDVRTFVVTGQSNSWRSTPMSNYSKSPARREGNFTLAADGTLEGEIKLEFEGHQAISRRRDGFMDSPEKRQETIKEEIKKKASTAEISNVSVLHFDDSSKPLTYVMKVKVPNYASKAGRRMIIQPGFFEFGATPIFSSATRTHSVYFPYPWSETDNIQIKLPPGYELDNADRPGDVGDNGGIAKNTIAISLDTNSNVLIYNRKFHFGGGGMILFPAGSYAPLKNLFDAFHKADTHAIAIRPKP